MRLLLLWYDKFVRLYVRYRTYTIIEVNHYNFGFWTHFRRSQPFNFAFQPTLGQKRENIFILYQLFSFLTFGCTRIKGIIFVWKYESEKKKLPYYSLYKLLSLLLNKDKWKTKTKLYFTHFKEKSLFPISQIK